MGMNSPQLQYIQSIMGNTSPDDYTLPFSTQSQVQSDISDEALAQQVNAYYANRQTQQRPDSWMESRDMNLIGNAAKDISQIGTGLASAVLHPVRTGKQIIGGLGDYYTNMAYDNNPWYKDAIRGGMDAYNVLTEPVFKGSDVRGVLTGRTSIPKFLGNVAQNIYENPVSSALAISGIPLLAKGGKIARTATAANKVEDAINVAKKSTGAQAQKVIDKGTKIKNTYTTDQIHEAVKALEVGSEVAPELKQVVKDVSQLYSDYDAMLAKTNKRAKSFTNEQKFGIADTQAAQATEKALGVERTAQEISKERQVYRDLLKDKEGQNLLRDQAAAGDVIAQEVLNNKMLWDMGYLKITPRAAIKDVEKLGYVAAEGTKYAGRASDRVFGTATTEQVTKQVIQDTSEWLDRQMGDFVKTELIEEIKNGTLGGQPLVNEATKEVVNIPKRILEEGTLDEAIKSATKEVVEDSVQIDKDLLTQIRDQLDTMSNNPFGEGIMSDIYNTRKGTILVNGGYLAGNLQTGLANLVLNEGLNPASWVQDLGAAMQTKGKLAKELGVYRNKVRTEKRMTTKAGQLLGKINSVPANFMAAIDAKMQNTFAEIAAHNNLRNKGIPVSERLQAIDNMKVADLAQTIDDVKKVSLINPSKTILPKALHKTAGFISPFWRWTDTAAQSTLHMYQKNPLMSYYVANNILGRAGFDTEMQNRMNLNVSLDKPFVSYRFNPRTGRAQELSIEFAPAMNTLKFSGNLLKAVSTRGKEGLDEMGTSIPFWSSMLGAFRGVDAYGNPIKRAELDSKDIKNSIAISNGQRYTWDASKGGYVPMTGFKLDEVLVAGTENLVGWRSLLNKTLLPMGASIMSAATGNQYNYYQPYGNELFGSYGVTEPNNIGLPAIAGDPTKPTGAPEMMNKILGVYGSDYYEPRNYATKGMNRRLLRGAARRNMRINELQGGY